MGALPLVLTAVLAASDQYSLVVARRLGVDAQRAQELTASLGVELKDLSAPALGKEVPLTELADTLSKAGFPDTAVCNGAAACVASLAKLSGLGRLVAVQLVKIGTSVAMDVSVVDSASGKTLAAATRSVPLKTPRKELEALAKELVGKLPPPEVAKVEPAPVKPPPPPDDTPKETSLVPKQPPPPEPPVVVAEAPGMPTGRKVALGLGAGAVVSLGVGIGLGASVLAQSSSLSALDPQYEQKASAVKGQALGADLAYGLAAGLAVAAIVTWFMSPPEPAKGP
ncbi:MAG: hypothetical protein IT380_08020 [Myxococcales bacterium]|nr:hypothetical protein [Myxococcales bacterium]